MRTACLITILAAAVCAGSAHAVAAAEEADAKVPLNRRVAPFARWSRGPGARADYFPISVWMQDPKLASRYKAAGINMYKNLWAGPTAEQLAQLRAAGMPVVCEQNEYALAHLDDPIIVGWIHHDEPDNAQKISAWSGPEQIREAWPNLPAGQVNRPLAAWGDYGPPFSPRQIQAKYRQMVANDTTRPIWLHLGQAVAWDNYKGRGVRTKHPEDYIEYVKAANVVNFDIYPSGHRSPEVRGKFEFVARGVTRLREWTKDQQIIFVAIECTRIGNPDIRPRPRHVKAQVWMAITHGARGISYFVHEFAPKFNAHALLDDPEMLAAVTKINHQIHSLARAINSPTVDGAVTVASSNPDVPVSVMTKQLDGDTCIFAVSMRAPTTKATFTVKGAPAGATAEVLGENRSIPLAGGAFADGFTDYEVHVYRIRGGE